MIWTLYLHGQGCGYFLKPKGVRKKKSLGDTVLIAYAKAKLKSNGYKAYPLFKPFLIGNMSDKRLPT